MRALSLLMTLALAGCATVPASTVSPDQAVYKDNFADPFILADGDRLVAYSTNHNRVNLPMLVSRDLVTWEPVRDATGRVRDGLPAVGPWAQAGFTWAPEVIRLGDRWLLYYTARRRGQDRQCIGLAEADNPLGPFRDAATEPLLCQYDQGGTIDANPFRDADGRLYLYFKDDGNKLRQSTELWGQEMSPDGRRLLGEPVRLGTNDQAWEAHVIEAPTMVRSPNGRYIMFYSANHFGWEDHQRLSPYAAGYAVCAGPLGPCEDAPANPILASRYDRTTCLSGPGHQVAFSWRGRDYLGFHAWGWHRDCRPNLTGRHLYIAPLDWDGDTPRLGPALRPPSR